MLHLFKGELDHPLQMWRITSTNPAPHVILLTIIILLLGGKKWITWVPFIIDSKTTFLQSKVQCLLWLLQNQIPFVSWKVCGRSIAPFKMDSVTQKLFSISKNNLCFEIPALLDGITYHIYMNKRLFLIHHLKVQVWGTVNMFCGHHTHFILPSPLLICT